MPLPMVHLAAAGKLLQSGLAEPEDIPGYYLGSIAPDGVHVRKNAGPKEKQRSHLDARKPEKIANISRFLTDFPRYEALGVSRSYLLGYAVHVLTDLYWLEEIFGPFRASYQADPDPVLVQSAAYYNDTVAADVWLYRTLPEREEIWKHLSRARGCDLPGLLSAKEAERWGEQTIAWYDIPREFLPVRYIAAEQIEAFIGTASAKIAEFLQSAVNSSKRSD